MKNNILLILSIILAAGIGAVVVYIPFKQDKESMTKKITLFETMLKSQQGKIKDVQLKEADLLHAQKQGQNIIITPQVTPTSEEPKNNTLNIKKGMVAFSQKTTKINEKEYQIDIYLNGEKDTSVDAIDLILSHTSSLMVKEIKKGSAFPSYARLVDKDGVITITGIAIPQGNAFAYGKTGELFATLSIEKKDSNKEVIEINTKDTQAYFNGTPLLDISSSLHNIEL